MTISLPDELNGKEYEEAVAAFLKANGYFIEKRVILSHKGRELFELDIVATPSNENLNERILIDAKSGKKTGFADIFKIYGWKVFLDIPFGCVIRKNPPTEEDKTALENYYDELKMTWEVFNLDDEATFDLSNTLPPVFENEDKIVTTLFINSWWFSIAERIAFSKYQTFIKSCTNKDLVEKLKTYEKVCNLSFFEKKPLKRVEELYDAFKSTPNISGQCIEYLMKESGKEERKIQDAIFDTSDYLWLQYVTLLEHRARYLIIKCAVEILHTNGSSRKTSLRLRMTPDNFQHGYSKLKDSEHFLKIPYLLQTFIELFGGYYIDNCDEDIKLISQIVNIPEKDIIPCLNILNEFFPTGGKGWFQASKDVIRLKFVPAFIRGIGSFTRKGTICDEYNELTSMGWLLGRYHNAVFEVISEDKKLIVEDKK